MRFNTSIIVKEVGQGFGPKSLKELFTLDIDAIDFGGTRRYKFFSLRAIAC